MSARRIDDDEERDLRKAPEPQRVAFSPGGMVSAAHRGATHAGQAMLAGGGNAVDAAVAAAFALGVCEPQASGLGGQTMMLVHTAEPRRTFALDGSSRAPNRATPESLGKLERLRGWKASTVPSTPATLAYALERYGTKSLGQVLEPAIALADEGFVVSELLHSLMRRERKRLRAYPGGSVFLRDGRRSWASGAVLEQPALASTLRRLAAQGVQDFYVGKIARAVDADMRANDGLIRDDDLAQIPWPIERRPVATKFKTLRVQTMPPPGSGRVLVEMLHVLENFSEKLWDPDTPRGALLLADVVRQSALDRTDRPFDPDYYAQTHDRVMTDRKYAKEVAAGLRRRLRTRGETTHLSVMDAAGNVVALTQSIERVFGSFAMSPELGFLYNNYMSAFEYGDMTHPYYMRPNAPPWASVAPTIVFRGRRPWLAIGSPGSERIVSAVLQVLLRLLTGHTPFESVNAPRLHASVARKVSLEASRFRDDIPRLLADRGYEIDERDAYSFYLGCVQMVLRERGGFTGVADPRRDGSAGGPLP
jgi:gamma-glutamyltranspeptidase/glutathione hydrolase